MTDNQKWAEDIAEQLVNGYRNEPSYDIIDLKNSIRKALLSTRSKTFKEAVETISKLDPLEAICQWENGDDIAFAVQKFIAKAIKQKAKEIEG